MEFKPSVLLFLQKELGALIAVSVLGYLWQGLFENLWWSSDYVLSLSIPIVLIPCITWVAFVPVKMEMSDESLRIKFLFREDRKVDWSELESWGGGEVVFGLEFTSRPTIHMVLFALPRDQRRHLIDFLKRRFPDRRAGGWFPSWGRR